MSIHPLHITSAWRYRTAAETQKEGYLRRRFAQIRAEQKQQTDAQLVMNVRPIKAKKEKTA